LGFIFTYTVRSYWSLDIKHSYVSFVKNVVSQQGTSQGVEKICASSLKPGRCTQTLNGVLSLVVYIKKKAKVGGDCSCQMDHLLCTWTLGD